MGGGARARACVGLMGIFMGYVVGEARVWLFEADGRGDGLWGT